MTSPWAEVEIQRKRKTYTSVDLSITPITDKFIQRASDELDFGMQLAMYQTGKWFKLLVASDYS